MSVEFKEKLIEILLKIEPLKKLENRWLLLRKLPPSTKNNIPELNTATGHITAIVDYAISEEKILSANKLAIEIVIENAKRFVEGTTLEKELDRLKESYRLISKSLINIQIGIIAMTKQEAIDLDTEQVFENDKDKLKFRQLKDALKKHNINTLFLYKLSRF